MDSGTLYGSIGPMIEPGLICESGKKVDPEKHDQRRVYYKITDLRQSAFAAELQRYRDFVAIAQRRRLSADSASRRPPGRAVFVNSLSGG